MTGVTRPAGRLGLWGGFLDRLPAADAVAFVRDIEAAGIDTVWLQEYSGVDPFVRAALYLSATTRISVALGVAVVYARDPQAMVAAGCTLEEAFPGRFVLGMGVSHRHLVESRGHRFGPPIATMTAYLTAMDAACGGRKPPPRILGALGPRMVELAGTAADGVHTYFSPVSHTAWARTIMGPGPWLVPTQMVAITHPDGAWREGVRRYLGLCLGMPNYVGNLQRFGLTAADVESVSDALVDALVVADEPKLWRARVEEQYAAGADQVVVQLVPPPRADVIHEWLTGRFRE